MFRKRRRIVEKYYELLDEGERMMIG